MIPTPAKRRQLFDERQVKGASGDDDDNEPTGAGDIGHVERQICDHETNQDNHRRIDSDRLTLAEQRLLLCKEQQHQQRQRQLQMQPDDEEQQPDDSIERAYIHQQLISENHMRLGFPGELEEEEDEEELLDEEYLGLDTIEEEDEPLMDSDLQQQQQTQTQSCDNNATTTSSKSSPVASMAHNDEPGGPPAEQTLPSREDFRTTTTTSGNTNESDEQPETMTTTTFNSLTNMDTQSEPRCDTKPETGAKSTSSQQENKANHRHNQTLLPSTNRLISEHQARQQQTALFRALAERQKLLDELGPSERQQVDLMSTTLPTRSRSLARRQASSTLGRPTGATKGRRARESSSESRLAGRKADEPASGANSTRGGVPLSSVDLSSMSDRMLDDLLGHIASASSSSLSSNGGESLDSSDFSPSSSSGDDDDDAHPETTTKRSHSHTGKLLVRQQATGHEPSSHAPSVIGVHEDLDMLMSSRASARLQSNCREAHRKSRRRNSNERDDDDDDDVQDELRVCINQTGASNQSSGNSLSPIGHPNNQSNHHHRQQLNSNRQGPSRGQHLLASYTPNAPSPIESSSSSGEPSSSSTLNSSFSLANSTSSCYSSAATAATTNGLQARQTSQVSASPRPDQSVEAVLGRMLEALNEVGRGGQATGDSFSPASPAEAPQEQLNDLLERGFLHLEQLLNCSLTPASYLSTSGQPSGQLSDNATMNRSHQQQQQHKLISSTLMSKDSDYGSDTQSADCYASSQMLFGGSTGSQPESSECSPGDTRRAQAAPKVAPSGNTLSPLAIDLSFKLAESLRRLAQQQQAAREGLMSPSGGPNVAASSHSEDSQPDSVVVMAASGGGGDGGASTTPTDQAETLIRPANKRKTPMKSIVMINSTPTAASSPNIANEQAEAASEQDPQVARNLTPNIRQPDDQIALNKNNNVKSSPPTNSRQAHKTCVSVNVAPTTAPTKTDQAKPSDQVTIQQVNFERRRARTSLRRRASFTGSVGSVRELGAARPGSPVPRAALEVPATVPAARQQQQHASDHLKMDSKHQQQLQRVLVLGQKYNYSPAKLAASKLSSKLQLKDYQTAAGEPALDATKQTAGQELDPKTKISGRVLLDVGYFAKSGSLTVHLMECQQLAAVSKRRTTSNPYVKLYLLPDRTKNGKRKSSLKRNELSPKFDERFTFGPLQLHEFDSRCLWLSVWHKDRLGRNEFLGELLLPLVQVRQQLFSSDLCQSTSPKWYQLSDRLQLATVNNPQVPRTTTDGHREMAPKAQTQQQRATAEQVARKLSEFEQRAARLAQAAAVAPPNGQQTNTDMINLRSQAQTSNAASPPDMMNVTLGPEVAPSAPGGAPLTTGQLFVALKFVPESGDLLARRTAQMEGDLRVLIKEAHNLAGFTPAPIAVGTQNKQPSPVDDKTNLNLPSPMAKCYLLDSNGQRLAKQKTSHLKRTANPRWDHECSFQSLKLSALQAQAIEIHLFNRDSYLSGRLASTTSDASNCLGSIRLCKSASSANSDSQSVGKSSASSSSLEANSTADSGSLGPPTNRLPSGDSQELCSEREARLWTQMLARPNIWVYGELPLRHLRALVPRSQRTPADS